MKKAGCVHEIPLRHLSARYRQRVHFQQAQELIFYHLELVAFAGNKETKKHASTKNKKQSQITNTCGILQITNKAFHYKLGNVCCVIQIKRRVFHYEFGNVCHSIHQFTDQNKLKTQSHHTQKHIKSIRLYCYA